MKIVKVKKYKGSIVLKLAIAASLVFVAITLIGQRMQITEKAQTLLQLDAQVKAQEIANQEIKYAIEEGLSGDAKFAEEYARNEMGYAKQGEQVFVNIGGN